MLLSSVSRINSGPRSRNQILSLGGEEGGRVSAALRFSPFEARVFWTRSLRLWKFGPLGFLPGIVSWRATSLGFRVWGSEFEKFLLILGIE